MYQKILRSEERMTQMKLISCRKQQAAHVHRQKIGAMAAANRHSLEQTSARNTHLNHIFTKKLNSHSKNLKKKRNYWYMKEELVGGGKGTGGQRPRKWNDKVPRGQCRKRCSGRNRAARRKRDGPVTKQQVLRMTSCFFDYPDSLIFLVLIWLIDGLTDQWTDGMIKSQLVLIFLIVKYYRYKEEEEEIEKERERETPLI